MWFWIASVIMITGAVWLIAGLADCVMTRGQHIGWPLLPAAGLSSLIGVYS